MHAQNTQTHAHKHMHTNTHPDGCLCSRHCIHNAAGACEGIGEAEQGGGATVRQAEGVSERKTKTIREHHTHTHTDAAQTQ